MTNFFEVDEQKKSVKSLVLDDMSVEELNLYIDELKKEIQRVALEIESKENFKKAAENVFK